MKKDIEKFKIEKEKETEMKEKIKKFFLEVREEEISDLEALLVLDFFKEKIASEFYNQGVYDAYIRLHEVSEDLLSVQKIQGGFGDFFETLNYINSMEFGKIRKVNFFKLVNRNKKDIEDTYLYYQCKKLVNKAGE